MKPLNLLKNYHTRHFSVKLVLLSLFASPVQAMSITDSWLNFREAYFTGSQQFQTKVEYGAKFDDVLSFSVQNTSGHGKKFQQMKSRYNEIETNYKFLLSDRILFYPGAVFNWSQSGTAFAPYVKLGLKASSSVTVLAGYRYNRNNYSSINISDDIEKDSNHEINLWFDWSVTDRLWTEYNFTYHKRPGNFRYGNGSTENFEHTIALSYKIDNHFTPYFDISHLDKASNGKSEGRFRVGVFYRF